MDVRDLQAAQAEFDDNAWEHEPGDETISHQLLHMTKDMGRLATYCEAVDHGHETSTEQLDNEAIPNLLMGVLRLANDRGIDIEEAFNRRVDELIALRGQ
jgi:hypothetical protein